MQTTQELLDALKLELGVESDYALAKRLGVSTARIGNYRTGGTLSDDMAMRVAELLKLDPGYVLLCVNGERAKRPEVKRLWETLAKKASGSAIIVLVALCGLSTLPQLDVLPSSIAADTLTIMRLTGILALVWVAVAHFAVKKRPLMA